MIAAMFLAMLLGWVALAVAAGMLLYARSRKRWLQVVATLVILWLPFWDVVPGLILYRQAISDLAGVRILSTVETDGYLDLSLTDCHSCWTMLRDSGYQFLEIKRNAPHGVLVDFEKRSGYYEYRLVSFDDARCLAQLHAATEEVRTYLKRYEQCVITSWREQPTGRYEYSQESHPYPKNGRFSRVIISSQRIRDRSRNELLAEARQVHFASWLSGWIGMPTWKYTRDASGNPIRIRLEDVLRPSVR